MVQTPIFSVNAYRVTYRLPTNEIFYAVRIEYATFQDIGLFITNCVNTRCSLSQLVTCVLIRHRPRFIGAVIATSRWRWGSTSEDKRHVPAFLTLLNALRPLSSLLSLSLVNDLLSTFRYQSHNYLSASTSYSLSLIFLVGWLICKGSFVSIEPHERLKFQNTSFSSRSVN